MLFHLKAVKSGIYFIFILWIFWVTGPWSTYEWFEILIFNLGLKKAWKTFWLHKYGNWPHYITPTPSVIISQLCTFGIDQSFIDLKLHHFTVFAESTAGLIQSVFLVFRVDSHINTVTGRCSQCYYLFFFFLINKLNIWQLWSCCHGCPKTLLHKRQLHPIIGTFSHILYMIIWAM